MAKKKEYDFKWYDLGEDNPFNKRVLDVRPLTWSVTATTKSRQIAQTFNQQRVSSGKEYIDTEIGDSQKALSSLQFSHDGAELHGIVYKSESMDEKWDIYIYDNTFLFVRSWTGELRYRAHADVLEDKIVIKEIEFNDDENMALNNIYFLMATHAMGCERRPHKVPKFKTEEDIALYSFQQFGKKACYACFDDIIDCEIVKK